MTNNHTRFAVVVMNISTLLFLLALLCCHVTIAFGRVAAGLRRMEEETGWLEREQARGKPGPRGEDVFILRDSRLVAHTDAGSMRIVRSAQGKIIEKPVHVGFITMEPHSLFIPQYTDSSLILFVRRGEVQIGAIHENELVEKQLKCGDIYRIPAGSAFYLLNAETEEKLHIVCSIDTSESFELTSFQSCFIGGGSNPASVLTGFDTKTLAAAFNVTTEELDDVLWREKDGPIIHIRDSEHLTVWTKFAKLKEHDRLDRLKRMVTATNELTEQDDDNDVKRMTWSWRKLVRRIFPMDNKNKRRYDSRMSGREEADTFNLFQKGPDFKNDYGWSVAIDESEFKPLERSGIGIYLVNLSAGSMMAPHVNPTATEYGIVLQGSGTIQIGYPNGSAAMNAEVKEGEVFWIPRYFPFCQISSRSGALEFFGFTTSSRKNRPQFLVGKSSVLQTLRGPELAASFGMSDEKMEKFLDAQREAVILPSPYAQKQRREADYEGQQSA